MAFVACLFFICQEVLHPIVVLALLNVLEKPNPGILATRISIRGHHKQLQQVSEMNSFEIFFLLCCPWKPFGKGIAQGEDMEDKFTKE